MDVGATPLPPCSWRGAPTPSTFYCVPLESRMQMSAGSVSPEHAAAAPARPSPPTVPSRPQGLGKLPGFSRHRAPKMPLMLNRPLPGRGPTASALASAVRQRRALRWPKHARRPAAVRGHRGRGGSVHNPTRDQPTRCRDNQIGQAQHASLAVGVSFFRRMLMPKLGGPTAPWHR